MRRRILIWIAMGWLMGCPLASAVRTPLKVRRSIAVEGRGFFSVNNFDHVLEGLNRAVKNENGYSEFGPKPAHNQKPASTIAEQLFGPGHSITYRGQVTNIDQYFEEKRRRLAAKGLSLRERTLDNEKTFKELIVKQRYHPFENGVAFDDSTYIQVDPSWTLSPEDLDAIVTGSYPSDNAMNALFKGVIGLLTADDHVPPSMKRDIRATKKRWLYDVRSGAERVAEISADLITASPPNDPAEQVHYGRLELEGKLRSDDPAWDKRNEKMVGIRKLIFKWTTPLLEYLRVQPANTGVQEEAWKLLRPPDGLRRSPDTINVKRN